MADEEKNKKEMSNKKFAGIITGTIGSVAVGFSAINEHRKAKIEEAMRESSQKAQTAQEENKLQEEIEHDPSRVSIPEDNLNNPEHQGVYDDLRGFAKVLESDDGGARIFHTHDDTTQYAYLLYPGSFEKGFKNISAEIKDIDAQIVSSSSEAEKQQLQLEMEQAISKADNLIERTNDILDTVADQNKLYSELSNSGLSHEAIQENPDYQVAYNEVVEKHTNFLPSLAKMNTEYSTSEINEFIGKNYDLEPDAAERLKQGILSMDTGIRWDADADGVTRLNVDISTLDPEKQEIAKKAMNEIMEVANIEFNFDIVDGAAEKVDISFTEKDLGVNSDTGAVIGGEASFPNEENGAIIRIDDGAEFVELIKETGADNALIQDSVKREITHELLHALGFDHTHEAKDSDMAILGNKHSVMNYDNEAFNFDRLGRDDAATLQKIYGSAPNSSFDPEIHGNVDELVHFQKFLETDKFIDTFNKVESLQSYELEGTFNSIISSIEGAGKTKREALESGDEEKIEAAKNQLKEINEKIEELLPKKDEFLAVHAKFVESFNNDSLSTSEQKILFRDTVQHIQNFVEESKNTSEEIKAIEESVITNDLALSASSVQESAQEINNSPSMKPVSLEGAPEIHDSPLMKNAREFAENSYVDNHGGHAHVHFRPDVNESDISSAIEETVHETKDETVRIAPVIAVPGAIPAAHASSDLVQESLGVVKSSTHSVQNMIVDGGHSVFDKVKEGVEGFARHLEDAAQQRADYVTENIEQTVGGAVGIGAIASPLMTAVQRRDVTKAMILGNKDVNVTQEEAKSLNREDEWLKAQEEAQKKKGSEENKDSKKNDKEKHKLKLSRKEAAQVYSHSVGEVSGQNIARIATISAVMMMVPGGQVAGAAGLLAVVPAIGQHIGSKIAEKEAKGEDIDVKNTIVKTLHRVKDGASSLVGFHGEGVDGKELNKKTTLEKIIKHVAEPLAGKDEEGKKITKGQMIKMGIYGGMIAAGTVVPPLALAGAAGFASMGIGEGLKKGLGKLIGREENKEQEQNKEVKEFAQKNGAMLASHSDEIKDLGKSLGLGEKIHDGLGKIYGKVKDITQGQEHKNTR